MHRAEQRRPRALELPDGWLERHGVRAGDAVELPEELLRWVATDDPMFLPNIPVHDP